MLTEAHSSDEKRLHRLPITAIAPQSMYLSPQNEKYNKDFSIMPLDYRNPLDWGKSPLTDRALQIQRSQAEKAQASAPAEEAEFDEAVGVWRNGEYIPLGDLVVNVPEEES